MDAARPYAPLFRDIACRTDISPSAKLVFSVIVHASRSNGVAWPGFRMLGEWCGMSKTTAVQAVSELEQAGLLVVDRTRGNGRSNRYTIDENRTRNWYGSSSDEGCAKTHTVPETGTVGLLNRTRNWYGTVPETGTEGRKLSGPDRKRAANGFAERIALALGLSEAEAVANRPPFIALYRHIENEARLNEIVEAMELEAKAIAADASVTNKAAAWQSHMDHETRRVSRNGKA